jgi:hypothetical protein
VHVRIRLDLGAAKVNVDLLEAIRRDPSENSASHKEAPPEAGRKVKGIAGIVTAE